MNAPQAYADPSNVDPVNLLTRTLMSVTGIRRLVKPVGGRRRDRARLSVVRNEVTASAAPVLRVRRHRTIIGVDMSEFGRKDEQVQNHVRTEMYAVLQQAFTSAEVGWPAPDWREDRGDGALMIVSFDDAPLVVDPLVRYLYALIRRHNKVSSHEARIVLRMAVHAGHVYRDSYGFSGQAIVDVYRMLDAPAFKSAVATHGAVLGLIVSPYIYNEVIQQEPGMTDPDSYQKVDVVNKETNTQAWLYLPGRAELAA